MEKKSEVQYTLYVKRKRKHVLLACDWSMTVWFGLGVNYKVNRDQLTSFDEWIGKICNMVDVNR